MYVSITRLRLRSPRFLPQFLWHNFRIVRQTELAQGFLGGQVLMDSRLTFWTLTTWVSDQEMRRYRGSSPHSMAMARLPHWCDEGAYAHWNEDAVRMPRWEEAYQRFIETAKLSRVDRPSQGHQNREFPPINLNSRTRRDLVPARDWKAT